MKYFHHKGLKNNGRILLIWTCRSTELFTEFADELGAYINTNDCKVNFQLYYTGDTPFEAPLAEVSSSSSSLEEQLDLNSSSDLVRMDDSIGSSNSSVFYESIVHGKPNLRSCFKNISTEIDEENSGIKRVGVFVCGSKRLRNSVLSSCVSTRRCHFTVHSESFTL